MTKKKVLRLISLLMLGAAVIFVGCALACPTLGTTVSIGSFRFGVKQWRICYFAYIILMVGLFAASFLVKNNKRGK